MSFVPALIEIREFRQTLFPEWTRPLNGHGHRMDVLTAET
jgi:hypothetical protein